GLGGVEWVWRRESVAMECRPGGAWRLTMFAEPGRRRIDWHGEYLEVEPPERLVLTLTDQPGGGGYGLVKVVLHDLGDDRTEMAFEQTGPRPPELVEAATQAWGVFFGRSHGHLPPP